MKLDDPKSIICSLTQKAVPRLPLLPSGRTSFSTFTRRIAAFRTDVIAHAQSSGQADNDNNVNNYVTTFINRSDFSGRQVITFQ